MELTLTVHVPRRRPHPVDVVVSWSGHQQAEALMEALAAHLGVAVVGLRSHGRAVPAGALVGRGALVHGASVSVVEPAPGAPTPAGGGPAVLDAALPPAAPGVLELAVVGGPDAGHTVPLHPPGLVVGRAVAGGLSLDDPALSRHHASFRVDASGVVLADDGSTNGVLVDGARITAPTLVDSGSRLSVGATSLRLRRTTRTGLPVREEGDGRLLVHPVPAAPDTAEAVVVTAPDPPSEPHRHRVPWLAALLPVPVALVLAAVFGPQLLAFALLGPVLLLGTALGDRLGSARTHRRALARHEVAVAEARQLLEAALAVETERLDGRHPDPQVVLRTAELRSPGLWAHADLRVRLGRGAVPTRVGWSEGGAVSTPTAADAPVVVDLAALGRLHVIGTPRESSRALAAVLGQLVTRCPPSALRVNVVEGPEPDEWGWVSRLPHATDDESPTAAGVLVVPPGAAGSSTEDALADLAPGWVVLSAAPAPPGAALLDLEHGVLEVPGRPTVELRIDGVGPWWSDRLSRALAPLVDSRPRDGALPLPARVTLAELLAGWGCGEAADVTADLVATRWARPTPGLRVPIGIGPTGVHEVDLVGDGPHALVGGTTGAGKSEFLRTWVGSLCATVPPDALALVLVDFKGGASFGACRDLPQVVGLLTDLDDHLVDRALASLGAELRRRERLFAEVGVADLEGYRASGGAEPLARLVVVVDEVRALLDTAPDFLHGLVRLAAQGRSLGVHLVLATQRPAGALSPEVQANVTLRLAFRVRDRPDSIDVVDDPGAADLDPAVPGRALARGADGHLVRFQAAVIASAPEPPPPYLRVRAAGRCDAREAQVDARAVHEHDADDAVTTLVEAVRRADEAGGGRGRRRSAWLAPLPDRVPVPGDDPVPLSIALVDEPEQQRMTTMTWGGEASTWVVCGPPRSGRSTAARAFALAAASSSGPDDLHLHVVDTAGSLDDLGALPHLGTLVPPGDRRALRALVAHLAGVAAAPARDHRPSTLIVVDGWERLANASPTAWGDDLLDDLVTVIRDGTSAGLHAVVTGDRSVLHPRWAGLGARTVLLGRVDPLDAALTGLRARDLPLRPPVGRGVRVDDRRALQFVDARPADTLSTARGVDGGTTARRPWRYRALPEEVTRPPGRRAELPRPTAPTPLYPTGHREVTLPVGLCTSADGPTEWVWRPAVDGRRLLVAGPPRSGRSTTLAGIAEAAVAVGLPVCVVAAVRGSAGTSHSHVLAGPEWHIGPDDVDRFVEIRRAHRSLAVLVDDAHRLDDSPLLPLLREHADLLDRDGGLLVVSTATGGPARFRGLDVEVARHRLGVLLTPRPGDGELLGAGRLPDVPNHPGRAVLVGAGGGPVELQVYRPVGSGGVVDLGAGCLDTLRGQRDEGGHQAQGDDAPPQHRETALDHASTHGEKQDAPDDRGRPGPGGVPEPAPGDRTQAHREDGDEQRRHDDAHGVAALTDGELIEVEEGEGEEGERLETGQQGRSEAGAA